MWPTRAASTSSRRTCLLGCSTRYRMPVSSRESALFPSRTWLLRWLGAKPDSGRIGERTSTMGIKSRRDGPDDAGMRGTRRRQQAPGSGAGAAPANFHLHHHNRTVSSGSPSFISSNHPVMLPTCVASCALSPRSSLAPFPPRILAYHLSHSFLLLQYPAITKDKR